jgi:hypothetical protein
LYWRITTRHGSQTIVRLGDGHQNNAVVLTKIDEAKRKERDMGGSVFVSFPTASELNPEVSFAVSEIVEILAVKVTDEEWKERVKAMEAQQEQMQRFQGGAPGGLITPGGLRPMFGQQ